MKYGLADGILSGVGVNGDVCRCSICGVMLPWPRCVRPPWSNLGVASRRSDRSSLILCLCIFPLLEHSPPFRPELCLDGVGLSDLKNFLQPLPFRYLVVDCTPSLIANSSKTHSVDFFVSSPGIFLSVFLKAYYALVHYMEEWMKTYGIHR